MLENKSRSGILNNTQTMVILSLFVALSIVLGKQLSFTFGAIRISFENLPILMAGIFLGCGAGAFVGGCADIIGCLIMGYTINPIITLGAILVGFISGLLYKSVKVENLKIRLISSVGVAHIMGSMIVKSLGLYIYYHYDVSLLILRVPLYVVIATLESIIIYLLMSNSMFKNQISRITQNM